MFALRGIHRRILFLFLNVSIAGGFMGCATTSMITRKLPCASSHPAVRIMSLYGVNCTETVRVIPYSVNIMALDAVEFPEYHNLVRIYLKWYLASTNDSDRYGLTGTIYDLDVRPNGSESWTRQYDSADAYAGTFLLLMWKYYKATGDRGIADKYHKRLEDMAYMVTTLQDQDGLTFVWKGHDSKYLMDNCETYAGMAAYSKLRHKLWKTKDKPYAGAAEAIKLGVLTYLFDASGLLFYWGVDKDGSTYNSSWDKFYPDALAQLYPIAFGLIDPKSPLALHLWRMFSSYFNGWNTESAVQRLNYGATLRIMGSTE